MLNTETIEIEVTIKLHVPITAQYVAIDPDGDIIAYRDKPVPHSDRFESADGDEPDGFAAHYIGTVGDGLSYAREYSAWESSLQYVGERIRREKERKLRQLEG